MSDLPETIEKEVNGFHLVYRRWDTLSEAEQQEFIQHNSSGWPLPMLQQRPQLVWWHSLKPKMYCRRMTPEIDGEQAEMYERIGTGLWRFIVND